MITGELKCGFKYSLEDDVMDDMELLDCLSEFDKDRSNLAQAVTILLGKDQKRSLYECLRKDGRVRITDVSEALREMFDQMGEKAKKS